MVVSPCTTFTLPENVASFFLSRISSVADSICIGWARVLEKPRMALGTPLTAPCAPAPPGARAAVIPGVDHGEPKGGRPGAMRYPPNPGAAGKKHHYENHFGLAD